MTRSLLSGIAAAVCATGALLLMDDTAQAGGWQVSKVSGEAWETTGGGHKPLSAGVTLDESATIVTGERSRVMLVRRTETMVVGPVSVVAIAEHPDQQLSTTVLQKGGTVTFDVEKRNVQHFSVETPMLAAVVKGTHFTVVVGRASGNVSVDRGTVQLTALASGQTADVTKGQRAAVDQRGLSISGQGRPAPITRTQPRAALVSPLSEVTPTTMVSISEFAATRQQQAPRARVSNPGLFSAVTSLFSASPAVSTGHAAAAVSTAATAATTGFSASGDRSAHTSASTSASGNTTPSRSTGGFGPGVSGNATSAAGGSVGSVSSTQTGASPSGSSGPSVGGSSAQGSPAGAGSGGVGAAGALSGSGKSDQSNGNGGTPGNGGKNGATGAPAGSGKSDQGNGNGGAPGKGGQNGATGAPSGSGKSDQGKGNGGTPGNGGVNNGPASSGKSDQGKGNGGTPGNGHGHQG